MDLRFHSPCDPPPQRAAAQARYEELLQRVRLLEIANTNPTSNPNSFEPLYEFGSGTLIGYVVN